MKPDSKQETTGYRGIFIFFLTVLLLVTGINGVELLKGEEPQGRRKGLEEIGTLEDYGITLWGAVQRALGRKVAFGSTTYEDVTRLQNGAVTMADVDASIRGASEGAVGAKALADELGADFLYVQIPGKERSKDEFPAGVIDYSIEKYDQVVAYLEEQEISVLPMRTYLSEWTEQTGEEWEDLFYRTDHHMTNQGAFLVYEEICRWMEAKGYTLGETWRSERAYEKILYEKVFLGTHGRMAGPIYTGLDDYELWLPREATSYTLEVPSKGIYLEGDFEDCFVHYENLAHYSYDYYAYYAYLKEDYDWIRICNQQNPEGPKVVIVRDSNAVPVSVFLAAQCRELILVDLRYANGTSMREEIAKEEPDVLLYLFGTGYLGQTSAMVLQ